MGSEIIREMRLACDKLEINAELFCNESADIVDGKAFAQRTCEAMSCYRWP